MNKCLVTTLKAQTNNAALSKYNVLTIKTKASDSPTLDTQWIGIGASENGSVSINSQSVGLYQSGISGELRPYPYTVLANEFRDSHFENKEGIIEITGKYNLAKIRLGNNATVKIKEIYGIPGSITSLVIKNIEENEIDITKLSNALNISMINDLTLPITKTYKPINIVNKLSKNRAVEFASITIGNSTFFNLFDNLSLDDLANNVNLTNIAFGSVGEELLSGHLSAFAKLTKLAFISFVDSQQNSGDIMDFINPWIQAGRTSGKIKVSWLLNQKNITLNGQPITYPSGVDNSLAYLNWTSNGTVTFTAI